MTERLETLRGHMLERDGQRYLLLGREGQRRALLVVRDFTRPAPRLDAPVAGLYPQEPDGNRAGYERNVEALRGRELRSLDGLAGRHRGRPGFLVASGPSLERNAAHLAEAPEGSVVLAVNSAARHVPRPTYYMAVDFIGNRAWVDGIDLSASTALLLAFAAPWLAEVPFREIRWFRPTYLSGAPEQEIGRREFPRLDMLDCMNHVAFTALHFLYLAGCDPIVLVGADYSYRPDRYHAGSSAMPDPVGRPIEVRDVHGEPVLVDRLLYQALVAFQGACWFVGRERRLVNATEGGVLDSPAVAREPLAAVVARLRESPSSGTFAP